MKQNLLLSLFITTASVSVAQQLETKPADFFCPPPMYPSASSRLEEEGTVTVLVTINSDNSIGAVQLERSSGFRRLDNAILELIQHCTSTAALQNGLRVNSVIRKRFDFRLPDQKPKK
jgi:TonB family protein